MLMLLQLISVFVSVCSMGLRTVAMLFVCVSGAYKELRKNRKNIKHRKNQKTQN